MASLKKYSTFDKKNRKAKPVAPAPAKNMPSKSMIAAAPRTKKSAERMGAEKAARKIAVKEGLKSGSSYGKTRKTFEVLANRMTTERNKTATRAKATSARDTAKEKIQKLDKKKAVFNKLRNK